MVTVSRLRLEKKGAGTLLSPLECDVLHVLWKSKKMRVRDVHSIVQKKRKVALTSIAVTLDRLHAKKLVSRTVHTGRGGEHYVYEPTTSKEGFEQSVVAQTVDKLINSFGHVAVNYFNERFKEGR